VVELGRRGGEINPIWILHFRDYFHRREKTERFVTEKRHMLRIGLIIIVENSNRFFKKHMFLKIRAYDSCSTLSRFSKY
jgi:hypothetical protein